MLLNDREGDGGSFPEHPLMADPAAEAQMLCYRPGRVFELKPDLGRHCLRLGACLVTRRDVEADCSAGEGGKYNTLQGTTTLYQ